MTGESFALVGGQAVAVRCHGRTLDEMVLRDPCGMSSAPGEEPKTGETGGPGTRMGTAAVIREAFVRARRYVEGGETGDVVADLGSASSTRSGRSRTVVVPRWCFDGARRITGKAVLTP